MEEIKSIFWHEVGHLCIDIYKSEAIQTLSINSLNISFENIIGNPHQWTGYVELVPPLPWENIANDDSKFAFSILSLVNGCIFQTIFNSIYLNKQEDFLECFSSNKNSTGCGDLRHYNLIISSFIKLFPNARGEEHFFNYLFSELPKNFSDELEKESNFLSELNILIDKESKQIHKEYIANGSGKYSKVYIDKTLMNIIEEVKSIIMKHNIDTLIKRFVSEIIKEISTIKSLKIDKSSLT